MTTLRSYHVPNNCTILVLLALLCATPIFVAAEAQQAATATASISNYNLLELIRTIAIVLGAVFIPLAIWFEGLRRTKAEQSQKQSANKRRATLDLMWALVADAELNTRQARIYRYRKFKENPEGRVNPYEESGADLFVHDCVVTLNIYDVLCIEILRDMVEEDVLFKIGRHAIVGAYENILRLLNEAIEYDLSKTFPNLETIATRWKARAVEENLELVIKIPGK